ncbi:MAG: signal peptidase II [Candidatus Omnitrophica bacterium]|nr:signal peptidase II [Candidatus Omnitrophota bacterium]
MPGEKRTIRKQMIILMLSAVFIFAVDQLTKYIVLSSLSIGESSPVIKDVFHITLVHNTGAAFGIMRSSPGIFVIASVAALLFIAWFMARRFDSIGTLERTGLTFIFSGTLGNFTDRVRLGYVVDFFDFRIWPVFNVADSFITSGAIVLAAAIIFARKKVDNASGSS